MQVRSVNPLSIFLFPRSSRFFLFFLVLFPTRMFSPRYAFVSSSPTSVLRRRGPLVHLVIHKRRVSPPLVRLECKVMCNVRAIFIACRHSFISYIFQGTLMPLRRGVLFFFSFRRKLSVRQRRFVAGRPCSKVLAMIDCYQHVCSNVALTIRCHSGRCWLFRVIRQAHACPVFVNRVRLIHSLERQFTLLLR